VSEKSDLLFIMRRRLNENGLFDNTAAVFVRKVYDGHSPSVPATVRICRKEIVSL
jgi:hypothetical protein